MEETDLHKRVSDLEQEVEALKASRKPDAQRTGWAARCQSFARLLIANWVLLSFVFALLVAVYVKYRFDIDYFENYRNDSATKRLSSFYEEMGDRMMEIAEWQAAKEAYDAALKINPHNIEATYGIAKAQVFDPLPGQKFYAPEVTDARLDYLSSLRPDDYQIDFLQSVRYHLMDKDDKAIESLFKSIKKNPNFAGGYVNLGVLEMRQSKVAEAETNFAKAVELEPGLAVARKGLAVCHLLLSDASGAVPLLEESYRISPSLATASRLGEAYWFTRKFNAALAYHQLAADYMNENHDLGDRYIDGESVINFLPLHAGDLETIKINVSIDTLEQKKAIARFELAIDHALLGDFTAANQEFEVASKLQRSLDIRRLIQNRMEAVKNMAQPMSEATKTWLAEHNKLLGQEGQ